MPVVSRHLHVPQPPALQLFGNSIPWRRAAWSTVSPGFTVIDCSLICAATSRFLACIGALQVRVGSGLVETYETQREGERSLVDNQGSFIDIPSSRRREDGWTTRASGCSSRTSGTSASRSASMGVDVDLWLQRSQLSDRQLNDPSLALAYPTFQTLVLGRAVPVARSGARPPRRRTPAREQPRHVGYAALSSGTLRQASGAHRALRPSANLADLHLAHDPARRSPDLPSPRRARWATSSARSSRPSC